MIIILFPTGNIVLYKSYQNDINSLVLWPVQFNKKYNANSDNKHNTWITHALEQQSKFFLTFRMLHWRIFKSGDYKKAKDFYLKIQSEVRVTN